MGPHSSSGERSEEAVDSAADLATPLTREYAVRVVASSAGSLITALAVTPLDVVKARETHFLTPNTPHQQAARMRAVGAKRQAPFCK